MQQISFLEMSKVYEIWLQRYREQKITSSFSIPFSINSKFEDSYSKYYGRRLYKNEKSGTSNIFIYKQIVLQFLGEKKSNPLKKTFLPSPNFKTQKPGIETRVLLMVYDNFVDITFLIRIIILHNKSLHFLIL